MMNREARVIKCLNDNSPHANDRDNLSNLHEGVLSLILSRLSTKEVVRTSILSRDWEFKWTSSSFHIKIEDNISRCFYAREADTTFVNFVDRVISLSDKITSFCLNTPCICSASRISRWISDVLKQKAESTDISAGVSNCVEVVVLPFCLLTSPFLRKLRLQVSCTFNYVDAKNHFPNLTSLILLRVHFINGNSHIDTLSMSFPVLEILETSHCKWVNLKCLEIFAPALTAFSSETGGYSDLRSYSIKIFAPKLAKFKSIGCKTENIVLDGGSQVVFAQLGNEEDINDSELIRNVGPQVRKLLNGFSSLEELKISNFMAKVLRSGGRTLRHYDHMRRLTLYRPSNNQQLFELLHATPLLKYLCVDVSHWKNYDYDAMECVPSCITSHLEEVELYYFQRSEPQNKFAEFLLKNGGELKKLSFNGGGQDAEMRKKIKRDLSEFTRRQPSLTLFFDEHDETVIYS